MLIERIHFIVYNSNELKQMSRLRLFRSIHGFPDLRNITCFIYFKLKFSLIAFFFNFLLGRLWYESPTPLSTHKRRVDFLLTVLNYLPHYNVSFWFIISTLQNVNIFFVAEYIKQIMLSWKHVSIVSGSVNSR